VCSFSQKLKQSSDGGWRISKFLVEAPGDIEKAIWLYENTSYILIRENFERGRILIWNYKREIALLKKVV